jgi:multidrug efflux system membrane fusion protein
MTMFVSSRVRSIFLRTGGRRALFAAAALLTLAALGTTGCSSGNGDKAGPRQAPSVSISAAPAVAKDMPLQIRVIGNVQPYSTVQIKAQVNGPIVGVYFKEGQDVRKGDLLFKIDPRPYDIALKQAESALIRDHAQLKNADDEVRRNADLAGKDFVTKERYDQLQSNAEVFRASVKADEAAVDGAKLQLEYCSISSPLDGRTGSLLVYPGNLVRSTDAGSLVVINQTSPIYVAFAVPEQNLPQIKAAMAKGDLRTEALPKDQDVAIPGVLSFVDNGIDPATGTVLLKAVFPNADKALWPGQFLNVALTLAVEKDAVVVPSPAVQTGQSGTFVMVVKADMTIELRPVTVARAAGDESVIASGLKAGETVVTDGHLRLVPGAKVEIKKAV